MASHWPILRCNQAKQTRRSRLLGSLPSSAETHNLRCRVYFTLERWDDAADECDQAVRLDGQSATNHLWLGRALGEKADNSSFITAYQPGEAGARRSSNRL